MPVGRRVGGRLERSGPEETHRPPATTTLVSLARAASRRRFRLQTTGVLALALIALLSFVFVRPRTVHIAVDGEMTTVSSRAASGEVVVEQAGVQLAPGDQVEAVGDDILAVQRATNAIVALDGGVVTLRSQADTVDELLAEAEIAVGPRDSVLLNGVFVSPHAPVEQAAPFAVSNAASIAPAPAAPDGAPVIVEVRRAVPFRVIEDGREFQLRSSRENVATALRDVGVRLGPGDKVQPPLDTELSASMEINVEHATPLVVTLPDGKFILYSLAPTVGGALAEGEIALPASYRLDPPADAPVEAGMSVHVVGISEDDELEQERIESQTTYQPDANLAFGEERVIQGHDGVRFRRYRAVYEDDRLISRELVEEWFDPEVVDTIVYYSTAAAPPTPTPAPAAPAPAGVPAGLNVARTINVYATWYNPASSGRPRSDPAYGLSATGVPVDRGIIAVDPSVIPLGTRMYIPGYGYGVAADTGGAIRGYVIDLGYPDGVIPNWASQWVDIYILAP
ncbi:MAG: ubiquitin-like domain-containing protein [Dehalococcoidia bacterium]